MDKDNKLEKMQNTSSKRTGSPDAQENVQKVSLDELIKMKEEIRKEKGLPSENEIIIEPISKKEEIPENETPAEQMAEEEERVLQKPGTASEESSHLKIIPREENSNKPSEKVKDTENVKAKKIAVKDNLVFFSSSPDDQAVEENSEEKPQTEAKLEPEEEPLNNDTKQQSEKVEKKHLGLFGKHDKEAHVEKIDLSELEEVKKSIFKDKNKDNQSEEIDTEYDENDGSIKSKIVKQKKTLFSKPEETYVAPDESLPDDITEADILAQMEQDELNNMPKEDDSEYEGMTEEEIIEAKERKRRLEDLKHKYNERETKDPNDIGDYKKNLDFSINKDIKRFRVKPPKKPFIIASLVSVFVIILSVVLTLIIVNQPPAEIVLQSIRLSQKTTYQYVGDDLDLRGLYIEKVFSDKHVEVVSVTSDMISSTSENIDGTLKIGSMNDNTFVKFTYQGFSDTLNVVLTNPTISGLSSVEIYQSEISKDGVIKFDNILILATVVDPVSGDVLGIKRIDAKDAIYSFESLDKTLTNGTDGVEMDGETVGTVVLTITYRVDGNSYTLTKEIKIV